MASMYRNRIILPIYFSVVGNLLPAAFRFSLYLPCAPPSSAGWSGGFRRGLSEHAVRVSQPPDQSSNAGHPRSGRQTGGAFSLVTFFLAKQKKVTSCRATPALLLLSFVIHPSTSSGRTALCTTPLPSPLPRGARGRTYQNYSVRPIALAIPPNVPIRFFNSCGVSA